MALEGDTQRRKREKRKRKREVGGREGGSEREERERNIKQLQFVPLLSFLVSYEGMSLLCLIN